MAVSQPGELKSMAKKIILTCDRCGVELTEANAHLSDLYAGVDLCDDCLSLSELHGEAAKRATIENRSVPDVLRDILKLYED